MSQATGRPIVIVLGMHRSGTSLCAHILSALGFDMADAIFANAGNAKGHWERSELTGFHDRILGLLGRSWVADSHALAMPVGWWANPEVRVIRGEMIAWLRGRMGDARRFGFKDPRTSLLLPLWKEIAIEMDLQPRFILCLRSPGAVARSLAARGDVPDLTNGEHRWLTYNTQSVVGLAQQPVCILPFEDWFVEGAPNLRRIARHLGLEGEADDSFVRDLIDSIVEPGLRHHLSEPRLRNAAITESLYRSLMASVDGDRLAAGLWEMSATCCRFEQYVEPVRHTALRIAPLEAEVAARDTQIGHAAAVESDLRRELAEEVSRGGLATLEIEELRGQSSVRDAQVADATAREGGLNSELAHCRSQVDAAMTEIAELRGQLTMQNAQLVEAAQREGVPRAELAIDCSSVDKVTSEVPASAAGFATG